MNTRTLGLLGILGSPFLALQLNMFGIFEYSKPTSLGNLFGLIYMTGWFCGVLGLYRINAAGYKAGKTILVIQLVLLTIGNLWNIYSIIDPTCDTALYHIVDMVGWPLDNIFMLATGIAVISAKQLDGWKRYVPFFVGLWFPVTLITRVIFGSSETELFITSLYSIIGWSLLGFVVYTSPKEEVERSLIPVH